jgi:hypothetical protein
MSSHLAAAASFVAPGGLYHANTARQPVASNGRGNLLGAPPTRGPVSGEKREITHARWRAGMLPTGSRRAALLTVLAAIAHCLHGHDVLGFGKEAEGFVAAFAAHSRSLDAPERERADRGTSNNSPTRCPPRCDRRRGGPGSGFRVHRRRGQAGRTWVALAIATASSSSLNGVNRHHRSPKISSWFVRHDMGRLTITVAG